LNALKWGDKFLSIAESWRRNWEQVIPFFAYPPDVRKIIYTTNAIESLNMSLRKVIKNRAISRMMMPRPSFYIWPCAILFVTSFISILFHSIPYQNLT